MGRVYRSSVEHISGKRRLPATIALLIFGTAVASADRPFAAAAGEARPPINALSEIAPRISKCWTPPESGGEITLRLSFNREGTLLGRPRIAFLKAGGGPDGEAALANSIMTALHDCTPLPFTATLGGAVAGRVLTLRFVGHGGKISGPV